MNETGDQRSVGGRTVPDSRVRRIVARIRRFFWVTDRRRLETYLAAYENELRELILMDGSPWNDARSAALRLVERAGREVEKGSTNTGWSCYNAAKRIEVLGFGDEQVDRLRRALLAEAQEKVRSPWRQGAIIGFVGPEQTGDEQPGNVASHSADASVGESGTKARSRRRPWRLKPVRGASTDSAPARSREISLERFALRAAMEVRDEALQNYYWKFHHLRRQLRILGVVLVVTLVVLLAIVGSRPAFLFEAATTDNAMLWFVSYLVGTLGGCLSAFRSYTAGSLDARIPEIYTNAVLTVLRPLIGGTAGILAFIFLISGLISITVERNAGILAVAFVAGFTERLVLHVVEAVGGGSRE